MHYTTPLSTIHSSYGGISEAAASSAPARDLPQFSALANELEDMVWSEAIQQLPAAMHILSIDTLAATSPLYYDEDEDYELPNVYGYDSEPETDDEDAYYEHAYGEDIYVTKTDEERAAEKEKVAITKWQFGRARAKCQVESVNSEPALPLLLCQSEPMFPQDGDRLTRTIPHQTSLPPYQSLLQASALSRRETLRFFALEDKKAAKAAQESPNLRLASPWMELRSLNPNGPRLRINVEKDVVCLQVAAQLLPASVFGSRESYSIAADWPLFGASYPPFAHIQRVCFTMPGQGSDGLMLAPLASKLLLHFPSLQHLYILVDERVTLCQGARVLDLSSDMFAGPDGKSHYVEVKKGNEAAWQMGIWNRFKWWTGEGMSLSEIWETNFESLFDPNADPDSLAAEARNIIAPYRYYVTTRENMEADAAKLSPDELRKSMIPYLRLGLEQHAKRLEEGKKEPSVKLLAKVDSKVLEAEMEAIRNPPLKRKTEEEDVATVFVNLCAMGLDQDEGLERPNKRQRS